MLVILIGATKESVNGVVGLGFKEVEMLVAMALIPGLYFENEKCWFLLYYGNGKEIIQTSPFIRGNVGV